MPHLGFAATPTPPYFAVIFTSLRKPGDHGYEAMADRMAHMGAAMPGYLGIETARNAEGFGITISYWETKAAILAWRRHATHLLAQDAGKARWYEHYEVRIARVERAYAGPEGRLVQADGP